MPHHQFFSISAPTSLIGVTLYAGTNKDNQVSSLYSDGWSASANVFNASRLLSNPFPLFQVQWHPSGTSRASPLIKHGDLWTSAGIVQLARFHAMLRLCVLSTSNSMVLPSGLADFSHATFSYGKARTMNNEILWKFFTIPRPILK